MNSLELLSALLRCELLGEELSDERVNEITAPTLLEVYNVAATHDAAHMIAEAAIKYGITSGAMVKGDDVYRSFIKAQEMAYFRHKRHNTAVCELSRVFEKYKIEYVLLKGSVTKEYYPEKWMRLGGDIDILVREEQLFFAVDAIALELGYTTDGVKGFHDMSLFSDDGVHLELHYNVKENMPALDTMLSRAWEFCSGGEGYRRHMSEEFFILHIVCHMAYHFVGGGCGIKPFSDLMLIRKSTEFDEDLLLSMLDKCGLKEFYKNVIALIDVWFFGKEHTPLTQDMESHVLLAGITRGVDKTVAAEQTRRGGRVGYILSRIFMPYGQLKIRYPRLEGKPVLTPIFTVRRWLSFAFGSKKRARHELQATKKIGKDDMKRVTNFFENVGLSECIK